MGMEINSTPKFFGELFGQLQTVGMIKPCGQRDHLYILRTKRIHCEARNDRGVDAATQTKMNSFVFSFAAKISNSEDKPPSDFFGLGRVDNLKWRHFSSKSFKFKNSEVFLKTPATQESFFRGSRVRNFFRQKQFRPARPPNCNTTSERQNAAQSV